VYFRDRRLATFRRKIGIFEQPELFQMVYGDAPVALLGSRSGKEREPCLLLYVRVARTLPILINVSAITPSPTHRFMPCSPR
jgi:hypothetical protein